MRYFINVLLAGAVALLGACGGGGGSSGTPVSGSGSGAGTGSGTAPVATPTLAVSLQTAGGVATSALNAQGVTASAVLRDASGAVIPNRLVTFSTTSPLATFSPASGQALTNAAGVASVQLLPASITAAGAGTVTATALAGTTTVTGTTDFQLSASTVQLRSLDTGNSPLAAFGNRGVSVQVLANGAPVTTPVAVTFAASCGSVTPAVVTTDSTGTASTTYKADTTACAGTTVTISASTPGATSAASPLVVQAAVATNVQFVSTAPTLIYLAGSTGATQAVMGFRVVDAGGNGLQNRALTFSLVNAAGGASLGTVGNVQPVTLTTDATGLASVPVFSGTVPTSVQVRAVLADNTAVSTTSNVLTVASGRAVQSRTSIALDKLSIEGFDVDGTTATVTVSLADRQGNPVPDGTEVNLTTEAGVLIPPSCTTKGGTSACSVVIRSQGARPSNGRVSILAYLPGEEDFVDANGNNRYDAGEPFTDLGNAYRDDNENGQFDTGEFSVPRSGTVACGGGVNGVSGTCDGVWGTVDVRVQTMVAFAKSAAVISFARTASGAVARIADANGLGMPVGSTVAVNITTRNASTTCTATSAVATIPNTSAPSFLQINLGGTCVAGDQLNVSVTVPSGLVTTQTLALP